MQKTYKEWMPVKANINGTVILTQLTVFDTLRLGDYIASASPSDFTRIKKSVLKAVSR